MLSTYYHVTLSMKRIKQCLVALVVSREDEAILFNSKTCSLDVDRVQNIVNLLEKCGE